MLSPLHIIDTPHTWSGFIVLIPPDLYQGAGGCRGDRAAPPLVSEELTLSVERKRPPVCTDVRAAGYMWVGVSATPVRFLLYSYYLSLALPVEYLSR